METKNASTHRTTILVVEDHPIVRNACQQIFQPRADIEMIPAPSAEAGLQLNAERKPDIIMLDLGLPDMSGFDILDMLKAANPKAKIIVFSMHQSANFVTTALEKGAVAYITKNDDPNEILAAIDKIATGQIYLGQAVAQLLAMGNLFSSGDPLREFTEREREIIHQLGCGKGLAEISKELSLSYKTVANSVASIRNKLKITTSAALIKFAVELKTKI